MTDKLAQMHAELMRRVQTELDEFRFANDPPGARYWELYSTTSKARTWTTRAPGEAFHEPPGWLAAEVNHLEAVTRRKAWQQEDDEL